ncbi:MAG TPA: aminoacetone oxidase family FAD-binding enzyme, partial [Tissierellaceae bacterium]|nr:aminoacetone oxidase family FAD-binding enzyme [Tissierellaceae bacterium]
DYGISGPPILQFSRTALLYLNKNREVQLEISIIHTKTLEELIEYLNIRFSYMPKRTLQTSLIGMINKRLIIPILKEAKIDKNKSIVYITKGEVERLAFILISWKFKVIGSLSFKDAQITAGGVNTKEIDNRTMESKLVKGLYITGELLDIDGDCGGFNLQWAWSSGYIAGIDASQ